MQGTVALFSHGLAPPCCALDRAGVIEGQHFPLHTASVNLLGIDPHHADRHHRVVE
jgi:hypothetical protein